MGKKKIQGIYLITCTGNDKKYIGKAMDIKKRLTTHKWALKSNKHINKHLQSSYNKYGKDSFIYSIIEEVEGTEQDVFAREEYYIDLYDSKNNGFNKTDGGEGASGHTWSEGQREKLVVPIIGIEIKTGETTRFDSIIEASRIANTAHSNISHCLVGKRKQAGGYVWFYEDNYNKLNKSIIDKLLLDADKRIVAVSIKEEEIILFDNIKEASCWLDKEKIKTHSVAISTCLSGKRKSHKGYYWFKIKEWDKIIKQEEWL